MEWKWGIRKNINYFPDCVYAIICDSIYHVDTVVIDTNVFASALMKADTAPRDVLRRCLLKTVQPIMGEALFNEYQDVLARPYLFDECALTSEERYALFGDFLSVCRWVSVSFLWRPNLTDEGDNHVIELAVAGNASHVVTGNIKHMERGELLFPSIQFHTPRQFINRTGKGE